MKRYFQPCGLPLTPSRGRQQAKIHAEKEEDRHTANAAMPEKAKKLYEYFMTKIR